MQADSGPVLLIHARHSKTYGVQLADMFRVRVVQQADFPDVLIPKRDQNTQQEQVYFIRERPSAELIAKIESHAPFTTFIFLTCSNANSEIIADTLNLLGHCASIVCEEPLEWLRSLGRRSDGQRASAAAFIEVLNPSGVEREALRR